jgi:surface-anchored protein
MTITRRIRLTLIAAMPVSFAATAAAGPTLVRSEITTFYFGVETVTPDPDHPDTIDDCHTDLDLPFLSCDWLPEVSPNDVPGGGDRQVDPEDALLYVNPAARVTLGSIPPGFEFIGATPGVPFWVLPQNYAAGVLWLGMSSETMSPGDEAGLSVWNPGDPRGGADLPAKWIRVELVDVRGPAGGEFSLWQTTGVGQADAFMSTFDGGITEVDVYHPLAGSHNHLNFGFTEAGLYEIDFRVSTYLVYDRGDTDCDGDVDLDDFVRLPGCVGGPDQPPAPSDSATPQNCLNWFDFDRDEDVDLTDYAAFQAAFPA